jgi:hypothetical protein
MVITLNRDTKLCEMVKYARELNGRLLSWEGRLYLYTNSGHTVEIRTNKGDESWMHC